MPDIQESLSHKTPLRHDAGQGILDAHPIETKEGPQFKQLDREITELKELASNGRYTEVWEGKWLKGRGEGMETEKVSPSLTASTLLMGYFIGSLGSTPNVQVTDKGDE